MTPDNSGPRHHLLQRPHNTVPMVNYVGLRTQSLLSGQISGKAFLTATHTHTHTQGTKALPVGTELSITLHMEMGSQVYAYAQTHPILSIKRVFLVCINHTPIKLFRKKK